MGTIGRPRRYHADRAATTAERQQRFARKRHALLIEARERYKRKAYHLSMRYDWETPWPVFDAYNDEFAFTLDVCASEATRKCAIYFSEADDGLVQDWGSEICWMNPPYGRAIGTWMEKAYRSSLAGATVVALVPSRTGPTWWHTWVLGKAEIRHRKGRIRFVGADNSAGFDSVAVIYRPRP
jgi:phage N-6-adenine-methyltransferase